MEAPRQKLMKDRATVVATTTLAVVVVGLLTSLDIYHAISISILLGAPHYALVTQVISYDDHMGLSTAVQIAGELKARGFQAWLVGGCVRDLVLNREPADYDIATDAKPGQLIEIFPKAQLVGAQFGVVLVEGVEVATFRSDHSYVDGRHPSEVVFENDPKQDVLRRDFTINALLLVPALASSPDELASKVVDYVGGLNDLSKGVIRAI